MPCTLISGQIVTQDSMPGRVWQLGLQRGEGRWPMTLHTAAPGDQRYAGETTMVTERWLLDHCSDVAPLTVDPPCGDGPQTVRALCDGEYVADSLFSTSVEMIAFVNDYLTPDGLNELSIEWFGWDATDTDNAPDMTASVIDGEVVWAE